MSADRYRQKAETLLRQAAEAANMNERGRLIDEALYWHNLAMEAAGHTKSNDNVLDFPGDEERQEA
jgi:hypothetical protein